MYHEMFHLEELLQQSGPNFYGQVWFLEGILIGLRNRFQLVFHFRRYKIQECIAIKQILQPQNILNISKLDRIGSLFETLECTTTRF